ncbi:ABC transporter permease [Lichenifustis flavocetrariae]|uniref:ABC transporter permease n=1 Tax=Lichenifustis flavocetrariae TaxID=2949735 RepID=A0AA41Z1M2_9HYPH|nr:ABC transporter permease [Lichenifustis flavocetrariae]MCW6508843.1 ABC transporter permease [Lichenifustis flavocetrariae]
MNSVGNLLKLLGRARWIPSFLGVVLLWVVLSAITSRVSLQSLSGVLATASFLAIAALGQMFVITGGRGNIDLSIPNVLTLSAYASLIVVEGQNGRLLLGFATVLGIGLLIGSANAVLVCLFRIPAIIATLASGYVLATATLLANRWLVSAAVAPALKYVAAARLGGIPFMTLVAIAAVAAAALVLGRFVYGRTLSAVGQNRRAAALAGIDVTRVVASTFVISAVLAALDGWALGAYVGGAFPDMGTPYLLQSVGAVVLGGSLIMGGASTALGTLFGSILLVLIVTTMQIAGLPPGTQDIVQGVVVIAVLGLAGVKRSRAVPKNLPSPATP